jgi:predicted extracellular nuclease
MNMSDSAFAKAKKTSKKITIGFYNLENLFDTKDDPAKLDDDFTPEGFKKWNEKRYAKKLKKLGKVISKIGEKETGEPPALLAVAEIENATVLEDLINVKSLKHHDYGVVHFDSPDERGIDVGLIYRKECFTVSKAATKTVWLETDTGERDYTRDILQVTGNLMGTEVHLLVNHWPSRRKGANETSHKRIAAAQENRKIIEAIRQEDEDARILVLGDFNDGPYDESVKDHLVQKDLYNPMVFLNTRYEGSLNHNFEWYLFDQIILSANFMRIHQNNFKYLYSNIYNEKYLTEFRGKFKGNPFRTYAGKRYLGGYSDHFPVYITFKIQS